MSLPELLAPAGTPRAMLAAIEAGADAVYFGGPAFNARMRAENFTALNMAEYISLCHTYGVKAYVTLNTLVTDKEMPLFLAAAKLALDSGADALIVADLGGAAAIHRAFPQAVLHASTQCSGHGAEAARTLKALGFSRMVPARELSAADMADFVKNSGMETEVFIHGALCVSHSGQCLFSSLVGGRSGNRGQCAQPCRLPDKAGKYPLSLKDLCLARHVPALLAMGVHSLKIEGRLKSPEYVRDVVRIWRRLLDERRAATNEEMAELAAIFSRGGFTDGYFTGQMGKEMLGVRSEADKEESRSAAPFTNITRRLPLAMHLTMKRDMPLSLTISDGRHTSTATGEVPLAAHTAPMTREAVLEKLTRLGGTPYEANDVRLDMDNGLMVPVSRLNALRREALAALAAYYTPKQGEELPPYTGPQTTGDKSNRPSARFENAAAIPANATPFFEHIYLPLSAFAPPADGVVLPSVIMDRERKEVAGLLKNAAKRGAKHALVGNVGHLSLALKAGLVPHGDFRLNITNSETVRTLLSFGFADLLLSPELSLPQIRDIKGAVDAVVYGRVPLMTLEKCVGKEVGSCQACREGKNQYTDRRGEKFPVLQEFRHRSVVLNCRSTAMSDKRDELHRAGLKGGHFIFTVESRKQAEAVIHAYQKGTPLGGAVRRI